MRKKLYFLTLLFMFLAVTASYALTAGDIAIIGVNTDATKGIVFVALADIPANTTITFTDNAWDATNQLWRTGEGSIAWTNTTLVTKGTIITVTLGTTYTVDIGSVTTSTGFNLSASGDQILTYEGTTLPVTNSDSVWLYGYSNENWVWANSSNTSDIPTALVGASVAMTTSTTEVDNAYFANGADPQTTVTLTGTQSELLALFTDSSLYYKDNEGPLTFPTYTITVSTGVSATITVNPATLTGFTYELGNGPSTPQTFTISGTNLSNNISIAASTNYEISLSSGSGYATPIVLTQSDGSVAETTIYVRLKAGLAAGDYNGETIVSSSTGATDKTVTCSGSVIEPTPTIVVTPSTLTGFNYVFGNGPSATQTFTVSGTYLTADLNIAGTLNYEISLASGSGYTTPIVLTQTGGVVPETTIYVRLKDGLTAGTYNNETITATSTGASDQTVTCSGYVSEPAPPTILLEENFDYVAGSYLHDNGWTAHSGAGTNPPIVGNTNLSYVGYPLSSGLCGETVNTGEDVHRTFTGQTLGSVYTSFLINVTSTIEAGDYVFHFGPNPIGTDFKAKFFVGRDAGNNVRFGLTKSANVGTAVAWTGYDYAYNTTYLIVLKYTIVDGTANDIVTAWINPDFSGAEPAPMLSAVVSETDIGAAGVGSVAIRQSNAALTAKFDGIRVTNDWAKLFEAVVYTGEIVVDPTTLNEFSSVVGTPSTEQSYQLSGIDLTSDFIDVSVTGPFQIAELNSMVWGTELTNLFSFNTYDILVRYNPTEAGTHYGTITHSVLDGEAAPVYIELSGTATSPLPSLTVAPETMTFSANNGETSAAQSATITSANLTLPIDIALASAGPFTFSATEDGTYTSTLQLAANYNGTFWIKFSPTAIDTYSNTITLQSGTVSAQISVTGYGLDPDATYATDLFFSEYIEGSSNNKAIEIFNGTGAPVDLTDYTVYLYSNGSATPGNTLELVGTLAHNDVYVIANSLSIQAILDASDITSTVTYFNGDDALSLWKESTAAYVDIFGRIGEDPGSAWGTSPLVTVNATLIRKSNIIGGVTANPDSLFPTLATEWDGYAVDYISDLGTHTFSPGVTPAEAPIFTPAPGVVTAPFMLSMSTTTPGGEIRYTTDGNDPTETSTLYAAPFQISATTTVKARTYATGYSPSAITTGEYLFPTEVADIATLRSMPTGTAVYKLTGEAVLTFQQVSRNQKYIQDATAAIVIDDYLGIITTTYNLYDGITGICGTLSIYNSLLQFVPVSDPGAATSVNNVVVPEVRTLASLTSADQAKLIKVLSVDLDYSSGNFASYAQNINATDPTATLTLRTFPNTDYSGTPIPNYTVDIICLVGQYNTDMQISPRFLSDFSPSSAAPNAPVNLVITVAGSDIQITWDNDVTVTSWNVYSSDDPYTGYTLRTTVMSNSCLLTGEAPMYGKRFYYVTANN